MAEKRRETDLRQGAIWKGLLRFAMPLLGTSFVQLLYSTVDLIFAGNAVGKSASAAIGASSMLVTCVVGFLTGISVGVGVIVSKATGARDEKTRVTASSTAIAAGLAAGVAFTIIGYLISPSILHLMGTPESLFAKAVVYIRIYFAGLASIITYNMCTGILRGMGNSRVPMRIQLVCGILNAGLDALFMLVFRLGIAGAAWTPVISQTAVAVLALWYIFKCGNITATGVAGGFYNSKLAGEMMGIGLPAGIQSFVITLSNVFVQSQINTLNVDTIAAFTAYFKIELIIYFPIVAFGQAMTTFTAQNLGADKPDRICKDLKASLLMSGAWATASAAVLLALGRYAFWVFNPDGAVIEQGIKIIYVTFPWYWVYVLLETFADTIRGTGQSTAPMVIILLNVCVLRTAVLFGFMNHGGGIQQAASVYPISWVCAAMGLTAWYFIFTRKKLTAIETGA